MSPETAAVLKKMTKTRLDRIKRKKSLRRCHERCFVQEVKIVHYDYLEVASPPTGKDRTVRSTTKFEV